MRHCRTLRGLVRNASQEGYNVRWGKRDVAEPKPHRTRRGSSRRLRCEGIAQRQPISVANDVKERISGTTPESVLAAMQSLAKATAQTSLSDTNAAAYIQSSVDMGTLYFARSLGRGQHHQGDEADGQRPEERFRTANCDPYCRAPEGRRNYVDA